MTSKLSLQNFNVVLLVLTIVSALFIFEIIYQSLLLILCVFADNQSDNRKLSRTISKKASTMEAFFEMVMQAVRSGLTK